MGHVKTLGIDPGVYNTWYVLFDDMAVVRTGKFDTPSNINDILSRAFLDDIRKLYVSLGLKSCDEIVIERFSHRGRMSKGRSAEVMHAIIDSLAIVAINMNINVILLTAGAHKQSYTKHHYNKYPRDIISKKGYKHGIYRPRLKRTEPCLHVMDSMTIACYRILRRKRII